jgi:hypothetical protein
MTVAPAESRPLHDAAAPAQPTPAACAGVCRFIMISAAFGAGLLLVLWAVDALLGVRNARDHGRKMIGSEVYQALEAARRPGPGVTTLVMGDSVARQLFRPGTEPRTDVRYVTSNYAIAVAGQYYLLEEALKNCPNVREVDMLLVVGVWGNDLGPPYTDDYFCGFFHSGAQVAEVWRLKRDVRLSTTHVARWLLPNLLAENAARRPQAPIEPAPQGQPMHGWLTPVGGEPILTVAARVVPPRTPYQMPYDRTPTGEVLVPLSPVSRHYLGKMRALCREKGVRLRVLPGPCVTPPPYQDDNGIYDGQFVYVDEAIVSDGTHVKPQFLEQVRAQVMSIHGLDPSISPHAAPLTER